MMETIYGCLRYRNDGQLGYPAFIYYLRYPAGVYNPYEPITNCPKDKTDTILKDYFSSYILNVSG